MLDLVGGQVHREQVAKKRYVFVQTLYYVEKTVIGGHRDDATINRQLY